ncbi:MAG: hypothetical protein U5R48_19145 [Gammaproteobacteria bacterium]|nr:hypothetical protein [Gammaproteobacteria bacterium]
MIDARGREITPGLFVGFSDIGLTEVEAVDESNDFLVETEAWARPSPWPGR